MTKSSDPAPNLTTRLLFFRVKCDPVGVGPNWHQLSLVDVNQPHYTLVGWSILVRGSTVLFASPKGWVRQGATGKVGADEVTYIEFARSDVRLVWRSGDAAAVDKLSRFDVGPLRAPAPHADVAVALDPKEMGDA